MLQFIYKRNLLKVFPNLEAIQNIYMILLIMSDETEAFSRLFKNKLYILITSGGKIELFSFLSIVNITKYL